MVDRRTTRALVDLAVALGFLAVGWVSTRAASTSEPPFTYAARDFVFVGLLGLATLPYAARRRWPAPAFLISLVSVTTIWSLGYNGGSLPLLLLVGSYWVAVARPVPEILGCLGVAVACFSYLTIADGAPFGATEWVASVVSVAGAMGLGRSVRIRGDLAEARAHAAEEEALRHARDERLRVSGELHDIVGHSLAIIAVQAGVGRHLLHSDPDRAAEALTALPR